MTAAKVKALREPGRYYDGGGAGLFLRVDASGAKRWGARLSIRGKVREIGLGGWPLVSLAEARDAAIDAKRTARAGGDPIAERRLNASVITFESAARAVHASRSTAFTSEKHRADFLNSLSRYAFEKIGSINVGDITSADVLAVLSPIWTIKPETARRVRQRMSTIFKHAIAQGWRSDDPAEAITAALPPQPRNKSHFAALPYTEVQALLSAVDRSGASRSAKLALRFIALTAVRSGEARLATWDEINMTNRVWVIPAARTKMRRDHRVPLVPQALRVLEAAKKSSRGEELVFPGMKWGRPLSDMTLSKLVKELGFDTTVHGLRTSFRTWAQERTDVPREVAEAALAHALKDRVEAAYARSDLFEKRRELMRAWAEYVDPNHR